MEVRFYKNFNKKHNSTLIPTSNSDNYDSYTCYLKDETSVLNPVLMMEFDAYNSEFVVEHTYAYIPKWDRYYFVDDISSKDNLWLVSLSVDEMGTYRQDIINSNQYIERASGIYNNNVVDDLYVTKGTSTKSTAYAHGNVKVNGVTELPSYFDGRVSTGCFVLQVYSNNINGVTCYALDNTAFGAIMTNLLTYIPTDFSDVSTGIAKAIWEPLQYITSVMWFPNFPDKSGTTVNSISFGGYSISITNGTCKRFDGSTWDLFTIDINVPKHQDYTNNNLYFTQLSPYSNYSLYFEPFGSMVLDTTKLYNVLTIRLKWYVEYQKGNVHLDIVDRFNEDNIIGQADSSIGISLPISQMNLDYFGFASGMGVGIGSLLLATQMASPLGTLGTAMTGLTGVGNAVKSFSGALSSTKGNSGSFLVYRSQAPRLQYEFFDRVDEDINRFGRPYCARHTLDNITGYCKCNTPTINFAYKNPYTSEIDTILNYMSNGFYIE